MTGLSVAARMRNVLSYQTGTIRWRVDVYVQEETLS